MENSLGARRVRHLMVLYAFNALGSGLLELSITESALSRSGASVASGLVAVAVVKATQSLPRALAWLLSGPVVDLLPRKWTVILGATLLMLGDFWVARNSAAPLTAWAFMSTLSPLVVLALDSAYSRALTTAFTEEAIARQNALKNNLVIAAQITICVLRILWPGFPLAWAAYADAVSYGIVIMAAWFLLPGGQVTRADASALVRSYGRRYRAAFRWVGARPRLLPLLQAYSLWGLAELIRPVTIGLYLPGKGVAVAALVSRLGALTGSALWGRLNRQDRPRMAGRLARLGMVGLAVFTAALALTQGRLGNVWAAVLVLFLYAIVGEWPWLWLDQAIFHAARKRLRARAKAVMQAYSLSTLTAVSLLATVVPVAVLACTFGTTAIALTLRWRQRDARREP